METSFDWRHVLPQKMLNLTVLTSKLLRPLPMMSLKVQQLIARRLDRHRRPLDEAGDFSSKIGNYFFDRDKKAYLNGFLHRK